MPARRKKSSASKLSATAAPPPPGEKRPTVTQVVEVVEEDIIPISEPPRAEEPPVQEPEPEPVKEEAPPVVEEMAATETPPPTRKAMVEELYQTPPKRPAPVMPEISMHRNGSTKKPFIVWALVTIIVAILTGVILFAVTKKGSVPTFLVKPTPTPTLAPTPTPTPTPAQVDKASFKIQVLNGGGTAGAASKMKKFLEDKGYKVASTGNTEEYTYESTEIHGKPDMADAVANLRADLKDEYTIGTVDTSLDASASADVQIIVGK